MTSLPSFKPCHLCLSAFPDLPTLSCVRGGFPVSAARKQVPWLELPIVACAPTGRLFLRSLFLATTFHIPRKQYHHIALRNIAGPNTCPWSLYLRLRGDCLSSLGTPARSAQACLLEICFVCHDGSLPSYFDAYLRLLVLLFAASKQAKVEHRFFFRNRIHITHQSSYPSPSHPTFPTSPFPHPFDLHISARSASATATNLARHEDT
ncbi:hypothetical protein B0T25DRAFT_320107 [Lasiosphaeria hispida]|uniref:Uncharacterized protein n=1 Tax=Lasiosphaeria hispida TaxID=260671 RepID=A0AAJ0H9C9_9PEZI|nr:hypothetical protein B0T25DRAFT_320107 [Lasiosphaeria hispida]